MKQTSKFFAWAWALAALAPLAHAQSTAAANSPATMAQAVEAAWRKAVEASEAQGATRRARAEQRVAEARWAAPPSLELSHRDDRLQSSRGDRETEVGIALPLWLPGQRSATGVAALAQADAAKASEAAARLRVAGTVKQSAWAVTQLQAEVELAQTQVRDIEVLAADVDRRVAAGDLARADALGARAELLAFEGTRLQAQQQLDQAKANWTALTGLGEVPGDMPGASFMDAAEAPDDHPLLRLAAVNVELARRRLDLVQSSKRNPPELVVRVRQEVPGHGEPSSNSIGVAVRVPFGTDDRNEPLLAAALSELEVARAQEQRQQDQLRAEVSAARTGVQSTEQQLAAKRSQASLLRERAKLIEDSFRAGETSLPETLRALASAAQAEGALARQEAALGLARAQLRQALGVLP